MPSFQCRKILQALSYIVFILNIIGSLCSVTSFLASTEMQILPYILLMVVTIVVAEIVWSYVLIFFTTSTDNEGSMDQP